MNIERGKNMNNKIPKIIHYIWFGNKPKSDLILKCISSWKEKLPDWEFIEWNENNYNVNKAQYIKEAYDCGKYAFASDYARFDILYQYGGVYLDTDVELLKAIPDDFLEYDGFCGVEGNNKIAPGLVFATKPKNSLVKEIVDMYDYTSFFINGNQNLKTVVDYVTDIFRKYGFIENGKNQFVSNFKIFSVEYFCAFDFDIREFNITKNTISIHHYACSWGSKKKKIINKIKMLIKKIIGKNNYKKIVLKKRRAFNECNKIFNK